MTSPQFEHQNKIHSKNNNIFNMKSQKFSKLVVLSVLTLNILFTIAILLIFLYTGSEPSTLIGSWFLFTTGELWMLSKIKTEKIKREEENRCQSGDKYW